MVCPFFFTFCIDSTASTCPKCNNATASQHKFKYLPIMRVLRFLFAFDKDFCHGLSYLSDEYTKYLALPNNAKYYGDWYTGKYCQQLLAQYGHTNTIYIAAHVDGMAMYKNPSEPKQDMWPLMTSILNLHPSVRNKLSNMWCHDAFVLSKTCEKDIIWHAFVDELKYLESNCM